MKPSRSFLDNDITYLPGVGPKRAELLAKELNITTFRDLLYFFPYKYIDKTKFYSISELSPELPYIQIKGTIRSYFFEGQGTRKRLNAVFTDETGSIRLVWFKGTKWISGNYPTGQEYTIFGKPSLFNGILNIVHPEVEATSKQTEKFGSTLQGQYSSTENLRIIS